MPLPRLQLDEKTESEIIKLQTAELREKFCFWRVLYDKDGNFKDIVINYVKFIEILKSFGFRRYDLNESKDNTIIIQIINNLIIKVSKNYIQDSFINFIKSIPEKLFKADLLTADFLIEKIYKSPSTYFSDEKFSLLTLNEAIILNEDTHEKAFFYFQNGFVECDKNGYKLKKYTDLPAQIWKNQIINKDFNKKNINTEHPFYNFCKDITGNDSDRFNALKSIIGYLLHKYKDVKSSAIILTDGRLSEAAAGRSGKGLLIQAISKCLNATDSDKICTVIPGKYFDFSSKHRYQDCELNTKLVHLDDIRNTRYNSFSFENLFNDIDTGIQVDKKNEKPFNLCVKIVISTNTALKIEGPSAKARSYEFELADYYNENFTPIEKYGHRFFFDWKVEQWNDFYNFMFECVTFYFKNGLIKAKTLVLEEKKLFEQTSPDFIEWCRSTNENNLPNIQYNYEYDKKELFNSFVRQFPDYERNLKQRKFTEWLKLFAELSQKPKFKKFDPYFKPIMERTAGGVSYIKFLPEDYVFSENELKECEKTKK